MIRPDLDFTLPDWNIPAHVSKPMPWDVYIAWLEENRRELIRTGMLEKLRADPNRCPVNAPFILR
jgi:hypothetical protein